MEYIKLYKFPEPPEIDVDKLFEEGPYSVTRQMAIKMAESFDDAITSEIVKAAHEEGIHDVVLLNKAGIVNALTKATKKKTIGNRWRYGRLHIKSGACPVCGARTTANVSNFCRKCGQALDWSD